MRQQKRIFCLGLMALVVWLTPAASSAGATPQQTGAGEKTQPVALPAAKEELLTELGSAFDKVGSGFWFFGKAGPDHYAYAAKRGKKWLMVADGKEGPEFVEVDSPRFSADAQHFAYRAVTQRSRTSDREFVRWLMVVDANNGPEFEEVGPPVFSPDGQHFAYRGKRTPVTDSREVLMLDGKEIKEFAYAGQWNPEPMTREFDEEGQPVFSPDGKHWAYRGRLKKNKEIILLDGQESSEFEEITNLVFSPDSQHFAYRVKLKKNQESIVLDGKETVQFDAVTKPVFSPDSRRLGYFAKREKKWRMIVDGQEGPEFEPSAVPSPYSLYVLLFSPDSQHVVQLSLRGKLKFGGPSWDALEIHDGKPAAVRHFNRFRESMAALESAMFSPDGQRLAYILRGRPNYFDAFSPAQPNPHIGADRCVVVDGQEGKEYNTLRIDLLFSPDSRHFAYTVHGSRFFHNKSTVVIDGQEGKLYDDIIGGDFREVANGSASPQHSFVYIGREGRKFYRVTQPLR